MFGGGKQSQTLEEIAGNIEGMVKQYSKIAVMKFNKKFNILDGKLTIIETVNCSFTPKRAIATIEHTHISTFKNVIDSDKGSHNQILWPANGFETCTCQCTIKGKNINIHFDISYSDTYDVPIILKEILLIG